jgi:hypothetical protein
MRITAPSLRVLVPALLLCGLLCPQTGTVVVGAAPVTQRLDVGWGRHVTAQPDGTLWCLLRRIDAATSARTLALYRSNDQGATWSFVADSPTQLDSRGALIADRGCNVLHVAWCAIDTGTYYNVYYQRFDTAGGAWLGAPDQLLTGATPDDQYYVNDIALTERGTVGIAFNVHRTPLLGGFAGWAGGLYVKRAGDVTFQGPYCLNTDVSGVNASVAAVGEVFHCSFRTSIGGYGIRYRAFDTGALQFLTAADVPLYGTNQGSMRASNTTSIAADRSGNLYILYGVGSPNPAGGALELAFASAAAGYATWTTTLLETDPGLSPGNYNYQHYTLANAEGDAVYALYARADETYQNLWARVVVPNPTGGALVVPDPSLAALPVLATTEANTFAQVSGLRQEALHTSAMVVYSGNPASAPDGYVAFQRLGSGARTMSWGRSCQGALPAMPRLVGHSLPQSGAAFSYGVVDGPANAVGLLFAALDCLVPPYDLGPIGMPGCAVFSTPVATMLALTDPAGTATRQLALPAGVGGFTLQFGALLLDANANPRGAVSTNALAATIY